MGRAPGGFVGKDTVPAVWGLVEWRQLGFSDCEIAAALPGLTPADLTAAWEYYARHPGEIEPAIRHNEAP